MTKRVPMTMATSSRSLPGGEHAVQGQWLSGVRTGRRADPSAQEEASGQGVDARREGVQSAHLSDSGEGGTQYRWHQGLPHRPGHVPQPQGGVRGSGDGDGLRVVQPSLGVSKPDVRTRYQPKNADFLNAVIANKI